MHRGCLARALCRKEVDAGTVPQVELIGAAPTLPLFAANLLGKLGLFM